jgi:hypothetical protein
VPGPSKLPHIVLHKLSRSGQLHFPTASSSSFLRIAAVSKRARRSTCAKDTDAWICLGVRGSVSRPSASLQQRKLR